VVLKVGASLTPEDVQVYCRGKIASTRSRVRDLRGHLSHTASGKIQKYKLREMAAGLWPDA
jgi:fatty-acyl-CoA synthase